MDEMQSSRLFNKFRTTSNHWDDIGGTTTNRNKNNTNKDLDLPSLVGNREGEGGANAEWSSSNFKNRILNGTYSRNGGMDNLLSGGFQDGKGNYLASM